MHTLQEKVTAPRILDSSSGRELFRSSSKKKKKKKDREFQEWVWVTWNEVLLPFSVLYSFLDVLWCRAHVHDESSQFCKVDVECHCDGQLVVFLVGHIAPNCSWMVLPAIWIPKSQAIAQCDFPPYGLRSNLPQKVILSHLCMR